MLLWSFLGGIAVFLGSLSARNQFLSVVLATAWALLAGLLLSLGVKAGDLGVNTLVILVVYGSRPLDPPTALIAGLLAVSGGILQTLLSVLLWPIRRYEPERRTLAETYKDLATSATLATIDPLKSAPAANISASLGRDHTVEAERFRLLADQAERIRLSLFMLAHVRLLSNEGESGHEEYYKRLSATTAAVLHQISDTLKGNAAPSNARPAIDELSRLIRELHKAAPSNRALASESDFEESIRSEIDALAGRLRAADGFAQRASLADLEVVPRELDQVHIKDVLTDWVGIMRANLNTKSAVCRHAIRLAVWVAIGDGLGRSIDWQRSYWIPMTIAVVLKPDFTSTFSRGILRLLGTFTGLVVATILFHMLHAGLVTEACLTGVFVLALRWYGPANYGIFSASIASIVVLMISMTGIAPREVIVARGLNTAAGGILALLAYAAWPTWERTQVPETLSQMIDATRAYFQLVSRSAQDMGDSSGLDDARLALRGSRSNAVASVDRMSVEPRTTRAQADSLSSILASSHSVMLAILALEAAFLNEDRGVIPTSFQSFAHDVEFTLYYLSRALRGSSAASEILPRLRDDYNRLLAEEENPSPWAHLFLAETDRLTDSLNTLRQQVQRWLAECCPGSAPAVDSR